MSMPSHFPVRIKYNAEQTSNSIRNPWTTFLIVRK